MKNVAPSSEFRNIHFQRHLFNSADNYKASTVFSIAYSYIRKVNGVKLADILFYFRVRLSVRPSVHSQSSLQHFLQIFTTRFIELRGLLADIYTL